GRRRRRHAGRAGGMGARTSEGGPLGHAAAGPRDREHRGCARRRPVRSPVLRGYLRGRRARCGHGLRRRARGNGVRRAGHRPPGAGTGDEPVAHEPPDRTARMSHRGPLDSAPDNGSTGTTGLYNLPTIGKGRPRTSRFAALLWLVLWVVGIAAALPVL